MKQQWTWSPRSSFAGVRVKDGQLLWFSTDAQHRDFGGHTHTILHMALNHPRLLGPLLEAGADPNGVDWADCTVLDAAVEHGAPATVLATLLAGGCDPNRAPAPDFVDEPGPPAWALLWHTLPNRSPTRRAAIRARLDVLVQGGARLDQAGFDGTTLAELIARFEAEERGD